MCPYLKGIHPTLNSWRMERDQDGWKLERIDMMLYLASKEGEVKVSEDIVAPEDVFPVVRLKSNLQAL